MRNQALRRRLIPNPTNRSRSIADAFLNAIDARIGGLIPCRNVRQSRDSNTNRFDLFQQEIPGV
jgi:hypothetical protein